MAPDFSTRSTRDERLEDPSIAPHRVRQTLDDLATLNDRLGGPAPSIDGIEALATDRRRLSILDVGTGAGADPRRFVDWGRDNGVDVRVTGIELDETAAEHAHHRCRDVPEVTIEHRDLFDLEGHRQFDIVHAALMLHHLPGDRAAAGLSRMWELSRRGVVVNDLHRHPVAYWGSHLVLRLVSTNPIIHHDGAVSILRGFRRDELLEMARTIGAPVPRILWWPLFRWQMIVNR